MKKAEKPAVPYLGTILNEISGVMEGMSTRMEDDLINFTKMRRVRL